MLSHCLTVTRGIESIVCTSPNYEESIGQSRSDNGVVTGKAAGKQDKCSLGLFPPNLPLLKEVRTGHGKAENKSKDISCSQILLNAKSVLQNFINP